MREYDLSNDYFYSKWPDWLRWALFFPAAILGCVLVSVLFNIAVALFVHPDAHSFDHGWYNLLSSALFGAAFVGIAAYIAPKKQFEVAVIMLVLFSIAMGMLWVREYDFGYFQQTKDMLYYTMHFLAGVIAACFMLFAIREEIRTGVVHDRIREYDEE